MMIFKTSLKYQSLLPSLHTQSHLPQRGRQQGLYNFSIMYKLVNLYILRLAPSDEGAVIRELQSNSPFKE